MIYRRYGLLGLIRISFYYLTSKIIFGSDVRIVKCLPVLINPKNISIARNFTAGKGLRIEAVGNGPGEVLIRENVTINDFVHIGAAYSVEIGESTLIGSRVTIVDHDHGLYKLDKHDKRSGLSLISEPPNSRALHGAPVKIGSNCWIGDGAIILSGVTIGDGVIVGANAVVTRSFDAGSILAGCPAKAIGTYK